LAVKFAVYLVFATGTIPYTSVFHHVFLPSCIYFKDFYTRPNIYVTAFPGTIYFMKMQLVVPIKKVARTAEEIRMEVSHANAD